MGRVNLFAEISETGVFQRFVSEDGSVKFSRAHPERSMSRFFADLAKTRAGVGHTKICFPGDSTSSGGGSGTGAGQMVGARQKNIVAAFRDLLTSRGYPTSDDTLTGDQYVYFSPLGGNNYNQYDARVTKSGAAGIYGSGSAYALGGIMLTPGQNAAGTLSFTPAKNTDTVEIIQTNSNAGTYNVNVDGAASLGLIATNGTATFKTTSLNYALGAHTINMVWASGQPALTRVWAYDSTTPSVHLFGAGYYGAKINDLAATTNWFYPGNVALWTACDFSLVVLDMTLNSMILDGINGLDSFRTKLAAVGATILSAGSSLMLATPNPPAITAVSKDVQLAYRDAIIDVATALGVPVVDHMGNMVSWESANGYGLYQDDRHPKAAGYQLKAMSVLTQLGL